LRQVSTGQLLVPAHVGGGEELWFILDTGASATTITPATRKKLGLAGLGAHSQTDVVAAGGAKLGAQGYRLEHLRVGPREYGAMVVWEASLDEVPGDGVAVAGILGQDFLALHDVELDFDGHKLRLYPAGHGVGAITKPLAKVPFTVLPEGLLSIDVRVDDAAPLPAIVDLGASASILNRRGAKLAGWEPPLRKEKGSSGAKGKRKAKAAAVGADGAAIAVVPHPFGHVDMGGRRVSDPLFFVGDLPVFTTLHLGDRPAMILGLDVLGKHEVVIDYANRALYLTPTPTP
jgi:predicted aspartyl protease